MIVKKLKEFKKDSKIALIIRHADRELIPEGEFGNNILINEKGVKRSIQLGKILKEFKINKIYSSPIERCVQTGEFIAEGYGTELKIISTKSLGDPGLHVCDDKKAGDFYLKYGFDEMYKRFKNNEKIPGVPKPDILEKSMTKFIKNNTLENGITIFITHDSVIAFYDYALNKNIYTKEKWVNYLSGIVMQIK